MSSTSILPAVSSSYYSSDRNGNRVDIAAERAFDHTHGPLGHDAGLRGQYGEYPQGWSSGSTFDAAAGPQAPVLQPPPLPAMVPTIAAGTYRGELHAGNTTRRGGAIIHEGSERMAIEVSVGQNGEPLGVKLWRYGTAYDLPVTGRENDRFSADTDFGANGRYFVGVFMHPGTAIFINYNWSRDASDTYAESQEGRGQALIPMSPIA